MLSVNKIDSYSKLREVLKSKGIKFLSDVNYQRKSDDGVVLQLKDCCSFKGKGAMPKWKPLPDFDSKDQWERENLTKLLNAFKKYVTNGGRDIYSYVDVERAFLGDFPTVSKERKSMCNMCAGLMKFPLQFNTTTFYASRPDGLESNEYGYSSFRGNGAQPYHLIKWTDTHEDEKFRSYDNLTESIEHISYLYGHPHAHYFRFAYMRVDGTLNVKKNITPFESYLCECFIENVKHLSKPRLYLRSPATGCYPPWKALDNIDESLMWVLSMNMLILQEGIVFPVNDYNYWAGELKDILDRMDEDMSDKLITNLPFSPGMYGHMRDNYGRFFTKYERDITIASDLDVDDLLMI